MRGIIITGHGNFATGIGSAVKLIAGEQKAFYLVDFLPEDTPEILKEKLTEKINQLNNCSEIIIFSDLIGGSPFKVSVELISERSEKIDVISGTNLGMVIEGIFSRENISDTKEFIEDVLKVGKGQITKFQLPINEDLPENGEGI